MKKQSRVRHITALLLYTVGAVASAWMVAVDLRENSGYQPVPPPYDARVVRYDGQSVLRSKQAVVQVRFADQSTITFGSRKAGRHELFPIGKSVPLLRKRTSDGRIEYEIDNLAHRYGSSVLYSVAALLACTFVAVDVLRWRKKCRAEMRPTDSPAVPATGARRPHVAIQPLNVPGAATPRRPRARRRRR